MNLYRFESSVFTLTVNSSFKVWYLRSLEPPIPPDPEPAPPLPDCIPPGNEDEEGDDIPTLVKTYCNIMVRKAFNIFKPTESALHSMCLWYMYLYIYLSVCLCLFICSFTY